MLGLSRTTIGFILSGFLIGVLLKQAKNKKFQSTD